MGEEKKAEEEGAIHVRMDLPAKSRLNVKARAIKEELGVHSWTEMMRILVTRFRLKRRNNEDGSN